MQPKRGASTTVQGRILNRAIEIEMVLDNFIRTYYIAKTYRTPKHLERTVKHLPFRNKVEILSHIQVHVIRGRIPKSLVRSLERIEKLREAVCKAVQKEFLDEKSAKAKLSKTRVASFEKNADLAMTSLLSMTRAVKRGKLF
jgi:cell division protein FtsB